MVVNMKNKNIKYIEAENTLLKKENEQLKREKQSLELQLVGYTHNLNTSADRVKNMLSQTIIARKAYEEGLVKLNDKTEKINALLKDSRKICSTGARRFNKKLNKEIKKIKI